MEEKLNSFDIILIMLITFAIILGIALILLPLQHKSIILETSTGKIIQYRDKDLDNKKIKRGFYQLEKIEIN